MPSTGDIRVCCIPPHLLGDAWPLIGAYLLRGRLAYGEDMGMALKGLGQMVLLAKQDLAQVWTVFGGDKPIAALFTELQTDEDDRKIVFVSGLSGEHAFSWGAKLAEAIAEFGRAEGAKAVQCYGRPAVARIYRGMQRKERLSPHDLWEGAL